LRVCSRLFTLTFALLAAVWSPARAYPVDFGPGFTTKTVSVDGTTVSVTVGGHGPAVVLLHGYAEDSRMWRPLAVALAPRFTVIAPDLPGIGNSAIPSSGLDMVTAAKRIRDAVHALGYSNIRLAGHDIGLMVAYAYAAAYPSEVNRLVLMDAFLPGVVGWEPIYNNPNLWHFRFIGPTPLALVQGREKIYFSYYWNDFAADAQHSLPQRDRDDYIAAYSRPGRMAASWTYFASFPTTTASAFAKFAKTKLPMPLLTIGGDHSLGVALGAQGRAVDNNTKVIVLKNAGHWIMEEQPQATMAALTQFFEQP
jgi:pimeloyl-ACP methyl ester carboxylesterase